MAYMEDAALERERTRQKMLEGKAPLLGDDTTRALYALGVELGVVPPGAPPPQGAALMQQLMQPVTAPGKGIEVKELSKGPNAGPQPTGRAPSTTVNQYNSGMPDLGAALTAILGKGKQSALDMMRKRLEAAQNQPGSAPPGGASLRHMVSRGRPDMPTGPAPSELIPGLKPAIDAKTAPPGAAAAAAYQEQTKPGPAVTGTPSGTYQSDLKFLQDRGGHTSAVVDGKITNTPLTAKGAYKDLDPELAARLRTAAEAYEKETGKKAKFGEFSRGEDVQSIYRGRYERGEGGVAARPGASHHQHGTAGDLPQEGGFRDWLNAGNKDRFGLHFPVKGDAPHVEANPRFRQTLANTASSPTAPAWDTTKAAAPAPAATNWPAPTAATAKTDIPKPVEGTRSLSSTAQPAAAGGGVLAEQRAGFKAQVNANPALRESMAAIMLTESSTPEGRQGVAEAMNNRVASVGGTDFSAALDPAYHDQMRGSAPKYNAALQRIRNDPALKAELYALQDKAFDGSNVSNLATDYSSGGVAASARSDSTHTFTSPDGQSFFRKDIRPDVHGSGKVPKVADWHKKTESALRSPSAAPAAAAAPSETSATSATAAAPAAAAAAPPAASVFEKGAPAVPVSGAGGLQDPDESVTTSATLYPDEGTAALNAVKPPEVSTPPAAAAVQAAPVPPQPAAAVVTPPPAQASGSAAAPPPPAAPTRPATPAPVAPAAPPNPAHAVLDGKVGPLAQKMMPGLAWMLPAEYANKTVRQIVTDPKMSETVRSYLTKENLSKVGLTPQQFDSAIKEGVPGKRSDVGTSGSTEFSSRARTPLAPRGLEQGVPTPQPRPEGAPTLDPGSQPAVQNADGSISTVKTMGTNVDGREVNIPRVSPEGQILTPEQAFEQYQRTGKHLGKYDTPEQAGAAAEALHQQEAQQISQHPQGPQQTLPPDMIKALESVFKDESRIPQTPIPESALPVQPTSTGVPSSQPGAGGLSLAPPGLNTMPGGGPMSMPGGLPSQGGSLAMVGMLPAIEPATFSTPLLDTTAASGGFNTGSLSPFNTFGGFGGFNLGGMGSGGFGGFDFGGGGGGFDFGGGLGGSMVMPMMSGFGGG